MKRQLLLLGILNIAALVAGLTFSRQFLKTSSDYPHRPIELVVPFSHGGGTDTFARIVEYAIRENELLPQPLTVINRGGAGATIGSRFVKDAEPDGYTMLILHDALITGKYSGIVDYGPEAFEAIAGTGELGMLIAVADDSPFQTLDQLLQSATQNPGTIRFGANLGALTHFAGLQLEKERPGAEFLFPQVGGGADRFSDLVGGHIDVTGFSIEEFHRFSTAGLRGLAYLGAERHPSAPDVPTATELGFDIINTNMFFWWFPKGTPQHAILVMQEALRSAMQTEYVRERLDAIQCEPIFLTGDDLQNRIADAERRFADVAPRPQSVLVNLPSILLGGICALLVVLTVQRLLPPNRTREIDRDADDLLESDRAMTGAERRRVCPCIATTCAYVVALAAGVGYSLATILFVPAVGTLLVPNARAATIMVLLLIGQCLGFGLDVAFTRVFDVSLP